MRAKHYNENVTEKRNDINALKESLKSADQKRLDKLLDTFYKNLMMLEVTNTTDEKVRTLSKSESVQEKFIELNNAIKTIIEKHSTLELNGYKIGEKVWNYNSNEQFKIDQFNPINNSFYSNDNKSVSKEAILLALVSKEPRHENHHFIYTPKTDRLIDNVDSQVITSNIHMFLSHYADGYYNTDIYYQRNYVWTVPQKQAYIKALLSSVTTFKPTFILYSNPKKARTGYIYEVLDGKQRINAILGYVHNEFDVDGYYYKDLSTSDSEYFLSIPMEYTLIKYYSKKGLTDLTVAETIELFLQINDYGTKMDKSHLDYIKETYLKGAENGEIW